MRSRNLHRPAHDAYQRAQVDARRGLYRFIPRQRGFLLAIVLVAVASPWLNRLFTDYRAIVLAHHDGKSLFMRLDRAGDWVNGTEWPPGSLIHKARWHWSAAPALLEPADQPLVELFERYSTEFDGVIVELRPQPQSPSHALVRTSDGQDRLVALNTPELAQSKSGQRLRKRAGQWDPELTR